MLFQVTAPDNLGKMLINHNLPVVRTPKELTCLP
ncbi:MAG: hypothetical protein RJB20_193, partial [Pseudomonadota bacterium]